MQAFREGINIQNRDGFLDRLGFISKITVLSYLSQTNRILCRRDPTFESLCVKRSSFSLFSSCLCRCDTTRLSDDLIVVDAMNV